MMSVVHPAYHWGPNGGHGSFFESGSFRLSCERVFATNACDQLRRGTERDSITIHSAGYVIAVVEISKGHSNGRLVVG